MLDTMLLRLRHRGPDDQGVWTNDSGRVLIGHTRLAIQDLTAAGHEPMVIDGGRMALTFNGEVFNHLELRPELEQRGHRFTGHCDAETLAVALGEHGIAVLEQLRGFFAFAWVTGDEVVLVRDRLGKKPLYYVVTDDMVVFASEVRALMASGVVSDTIDGEALDTFLALGAVPAPSTLLAGVRSVPPASHVTIDASGVGHAVRWWEPPTPSDHAPLDVVGELEAHLRASVRDRLLADVSVGAFLSGGLDSPTIVALMQQESGQRVSTFTVGFEAGVSTHDEGAVAALVAGALGCDHHDVVLAAADMPRHFDEFLSALDQPAGDAFNSFLVSSAAASRTTVVLSGVGADEVLYGYAFWRRAQRLRAARAIRRSLPESMRGSVAELVGGTQHLGRTGRARKAAAVLAAPELSRRLLTRRERSSLRRPHADARVERWLFDVAARPDAGRQSDVRSYLEPVLLADLDAMTMHRSLEARAPFLDHRLVEWALRLPPRLCWDRRGGKAPLRRLAARLLPDGIVDLPKRGFDLPYGAWLDGALREQADELVAAAAVRGLIDARTLEDALDDVRRGRRQGRAVWHVLVLEGWLQRHAPSASFADVS